MGRNKIIYDGNTLIDLTGDTVTEETLLAGITAHDAAGEVIEGECTYDADTSDADANAAEILLNKSAYVNGNKVVGSMPNRGGVNGSISTKDGQYTIQQGYHDGSGKVGIDATEKLKLVPENIREGITLLGVVGSMSGTEDVHAESPTVTPSAQQQVVVPGTGYNYLAQVTVGAIPYVETPNAAGGTTVTIG